MRVRYTAPATRSLERVLDHISEQSPQGARRVQARIQAMIGLLSRHPHAGHLTGRWDTRRIVASPYPYLIFYRATEDEVIIDAIRHAARAPSQGPDEGARQSRTIDLGP